MQLRDNGNWSGGVPQPFQPISCQVWDRYPDTVKVGINSALSNQNGITCGMENFLLIERDYVDQVSFGLQISWYLIHSMRSKGGKKKADLTTSP
ncbi:hypothetical protein T4B_9132 [Trichinella pseudospiralis]|uniref:Uncharacterized protein n=1 Tax=Trichinella pseudospiralis TaxID=6337 RepID=A0A0V1E5R7_TRIPS|nr:hypothetical protein T4A_1444 [Trichinella pseudospiralis]KRY99942.1 hypothetical protein T4B_9132 [Trichinella pseudospiralis]